MPDYRTHAPVRARGADLLYPITPSLVYVTRTTGGCEGVEHGDVLFVRQITANACQGDIATTFDPVRHRPTGSCDFGRFVEYRR